MDSRISLYGTRNEKLRQLSEDYWNERNIWSYKMIEDVIVSNPTYEECIHAITVRASFLDKIYDPSEEVLSYYRFLYEL